MVGFFYRLVSVITSNFFFPSERQVLKRKHIWTRPLSLGARIEMPTQSSPVPVTSQMPKRLHLYSPNPAKHTYFLSWLYVDSKQPVTFQRPYLEDPVIWICLWKVDDRMLWHRILPHVLVWKKDVFVYLLRERRDRVGGRSGKSYFFWKISRAVFNANLLWMGMVKSGLTLRRN